MILQRTNNPRALAVEKADNRKEKGEQMKKALFLVLSVIMVIGISSTGFALETYSDTFTFTPPVSVSQGGSIPWYFTLPTESHTIAFTDATLTLTLSDVTPGSNRGIPPFTIGEVIAGLNYPLFAVNLQPGVNQFKIDDGALALLNNAVHDSYQHGTTSGGLITPAPLDFSIYAAYGNFTLSKAGLFGTHAPEPASMLLFGTGIIGMPITRRIRKLLSRGAES